MRRCTGGAIGTARRTGVPLSRASFSGAATNRNEIDDEWGRIYGERIEAEAKAKWDKHPKNPKNLGPNHPPKEWEGYGKEEVDSMRQDMTCENLKDTQWGSAVS